MKPFQPVQDTVSLLAWARFSRLTVAGEQRRMFENHAKAPQAHKRLRTFALSMLRKITPKRHMLPADPAAYMSLTPKGQIIRVLSGYAWVTCHGLDILLKPGQELRLPRKGDAVVISAVGSATLIFEISHK